MTVIKQEDICDSCGGTDQVTAVHFKTQNWCLDCMRMAGHCVSCDAYIPNLVEDYYNYEHDECPDCVELHKSLK